MGVIKGIYKSSDYSSECSEADGSSTSIAYHSAVGDQTDEGMGRKQTQGNNKRVLQRLEIILVNAGVDDIQEDRRNLGASSQGVLNSGVFSEQLCREVGVGDVAVVGRELVAVQAKRANPELSTRVDLTINQAGRSKAKCRLDDDEK
jgi:hypothetical protein